MTSPTCPLHDTCLIRVTDATFPGFYSSDISSGSGGSSGAPRGRNYLETAAQLLNEAASHSRLGKTMRPSTPPSVRAALWVAGCMEAGATHVIVEHDTVPGCWLLVVFCCVCQSRGDNNDSLYLAILWSNVSFHNGRVSLHRFSLTRK